VANLIEANSKLSDRLQSCQQSKSQLLGQLQVPPPPPPSTHPPRLPHDFGKGQSVQKWTEAKFPCRETLNPIEHKPSTVGSGLMGH